MNRTSIKHMLKLLQPFRRNIEKLTQLLPDSTSNAGTAAAAASHLIRAGLWLMLVVFGIFGLWSLLAPLDSAAIAPGQVALDSNKKSIQHLEGGIIDEILVREGQSVDANQPLIRLRGTASKSKLASARVQYFTAKATELRLKAEQNLAESLIFPDTMMEEAKNDSSKQEVLDNQQKLFASRREGYQAQVNGLNKKIEEYKHDIEGFGAQEKAAARNLALLEEEVASTKRLFAKGYASKPRLLALQRQAEEMRGVRGQYRSSVARTQQSIAEAEQQMITLKQEAASRTANEVKETQAALAELGEQVNTSSDVVDRVIITSPIEGYVTGLNVHTAGGVISPGERLMDIVPVSDKLIIEAQVSPRDIDVVHPGLAAHIRLSAYRSRWMPTIKGKVVTVSADRMIEPHTQVAYFLARIEVDPDYLKGLKDITLYPGMPAETLIVTGERTLMGYLMSPILDATRHSFRED